MIHCDTIGANIKKSYDVCIEFVVNEQFIEYMNQMRACAKSATAELKCPVMHLLQIEEHLAKHLGKMR